MEIPHLPGIESPPEEQPGALPHLPGLSDETMALEQRRQIAADDVPAMRLGLQALPFGAIARAGERMAVGRATEQMQRGRIPSLGDDAALARQEQEQAFNRELTQDFGGEAISHFASAPAIVGEMAVAGPLLGAAGEAGAGLAARAGLSGLAGSAAGVAGRMAGTGVASAALMPSMGFPEAAAEGDAARGFGRAAIQGAIFGTLGRLTRTAVPGEGVGWSLARTGAGAVAFPLEGLAADLVTGTAGLQTGYGNLGHLWEGFYHGKEGEKDKGLRGLAVQALMGAAFAGHHEVLNAFTAATNHLRRQGYSENRSAEVLERAVENPEQASGPVGEYARMMAGVRGAEAGPPAGEAPFTERSASEVQRTPAEGEQVGVSPGEVGGGSPPKVGLVVASIGRDGRMYYGERGDTHGDLTRRYPGQWDEATTDTQHGFAGPDGRFLDRDAAYNVVAAQRTVSPGTVSHAADALGSTQLRAAQLDNPVDTSLRGRLSPLQKARAELRESSRRSGKELTDRDFGYIDRALEENHLEEAIQTLTGGIATSYTDTPQLREYARIYTQRFEAARLGAAEVQPTTPVGEQVGVAPPEVGVAPQDVRAAREAGQAAPAETSEGPPEAPVPPRIDPASQGTVDPSQPVQRATAPSGEAGSQPGVVTGGERAPTIKPLEPTAQQRYATLNDRERLVYDSRTSDAPKTLAAIARKLGVSREMARQIEQSAVKKMGGSESLETLIKREAGEREALLRGATEQIRESAKEEAGDRTVAEGMTGNVRDPEQALNRQLDDLVDRLSRQEIDPDTFAREAQRLQAAVEDVKRVPLTDLEKRTLIGGGQENATSAERNTRPARITALANAMVDAERAKGKLPPLMRQARLANPEAWAEAMRRIEADPGLPQRLVNELAQQSRSTTVHENAFLLHEKIRLASEYRTAMTELMDLWHPRNKGRLEEIATAEARERDLLAQVERLDRVTTDTGTEWGRAGQFRKQLAAEDYSLAGMMQKAAAAKGRPLTEAEKAEIARIAQELESLQKKVEKLEAAGEPRRGRVDRDASAARYKLKQARGQYGSHIDSWRRASRPWANKVLDSAIESSNLVRTAQLGLDLQAIFRQGLVPTLSHPIMGARDAIESFSALRSPEAAFRAHEELQQRPMYRDGTFQRMGIQFTEPNGKLRGTEESFISRWMGDLRKLPGIGYVARAYGALERLQVTYLNRMRADYAEVLARSLSSTTKPTQAEGEILGNMVNVATGRGGLGPFEGERAASALTQVFLSPRFTMSRFQLAMAQPLLKGITRGGNWNARRVIATEYVRTGVGLLALYSLAAAAGLSPGIETDNRSANFLKLRIGNTHLDLLGGVQQAFVLMMRLARGAKKTQTGRIMPLRGVQHFGDDSGWEVAGQFVRGRMTPIAGLAYDPILGRGKDPIGQPLTIGNVAARAEPLSIKDIRQALGDLGAPRGLAVSLFALFGGGVQTQTQR